MRSMLTAVWQRVLAFLGAVSMYRAVLTALGALAVVAVVLAFFGVIVSPTPIEILVSFVVLVVATAAIDIVAQLLLRIPWRLESSLITALILLFVVQPGTDGATLIGLAVAGALAAASKYIIAWRGRHLLNPAAVGAAVVTIFQWGASSSWWVGTPVLVIPVVILGLFILLRTEKVQIALVFLVVATSFSVIRQFVQGQQAGLDTDLATAFSFALLQSPFLFLGAFMLSEPLTMPPRRWQQFLVAILVGGLAGWPISVAGLFTLGQERALLIGNLLAFALSFRVGARLVLKKKIALTPTVQELLFQVQGPLRFRAGQYLELSAPHRRADARGTRREFSIVSAPSDLPTVRLAYKVSNPDRPSSYKRALAAAKPGTDFRATGVWGDFVLPREDAPILLVAAGIGITPFLSQLREDRALGGRRDIVLVYVASSAEELAFRAELEELRVRTIVFTPDEPIRLAPRWSWAGGARLDADALNTAVPDIAVRQAYVSGPPRLIAAIMPALRRASALTTDAFSGY